MKILGLLSILFILRVDSRSLDNYVINTVCLEGCKCQNTNNMTLEISDCTRPINITSAFKSTITEFKNIRFNQVTVENIGRLSFTVFTELENLEFNASEIKNIHPEAFFRDDFGTLKFAKCKFGNIPTIHCDDLEELIIVNSNLKQIPDLNKFSSLTILNLDGNNINEIHEKTFEKMELLEEVNLTNNQIQSISPKLFNFKNQLNSLDLSNNLLKDVVLEGTINLEVLTLASNQLRKFDSSFSKYLKNLKTLDLSNNKITNISQDTFSYMPSLEMVNLGYNRLTVLDNNTFAYNTLLEKVILDGNNFKTLPTFKGHFDVLKAMYSFSCRNCGLTHLSPFTFGSMPNLVQIALSGNNLGILDPKAFSMVHKLQILDLSNNNLSDLNIHVFSDNKELIEINLSKNPLKVLNPEYFVGLDALKKLDASSAHLKSLWIDNYSYNLSRLEQLIISNNSIEDITTSDLKVMPNLKYIDLENNPIQCTLDLANLIRWLTSNGVYSPEGAHFLRTHEKLSGDASQYFENLYDHKNHWEKLAKTACTPTNDEHKNTNNDHVMDQVIKNLREINSVPKVEAPHPELDDESEEDEDEDIDQKYSVDDDDDTEELNTAEIKDKFTLNEATYIISVTSVFVITALIVLSAAVSITLVILKRHNTLNINNGNLPRIKIPRWETMPSRKKHSGSIYRPLSEEILTPPTPKFNRYEFKTTPTVHGP